ncbi:hypothetical protein RUM43_006512 [Polyplax serrata]|uniref:Platelet-derived growth factor (PDGF) family profile domain-containing protein n=1 Tax=Polyplax serrata TaxID=468196 RepID=A0AAN8PBK2_POLSC
MTLKCSTVSILLLCNFFTITWCGKNGGQIVFPDSLSPKSPYSSAIGIGPTQSHSEKESKEIPLDLIRQLNEVSGVEELFENLIEPVQGKGRDMPTVLSARIGSENVERNALKAAKMAKCMPEMRTVPLKPDKTKATFYYPSCTRVQRCGGCCSHHLLSCQPVETEIIPMSIVVTDYLGGNKLQFRGQKIIEVEQHTKCKCDCKIKAENCSRYQKYNPDKCQCECTNTDEEKKCSDEKTMKIWNSDNCSCVCREELDCGSGYYFDPFTCSCTAYRGRKKPNFLYNWTGTPLNVNGNEGDITLHGRADSDNQKVKSGEDML